MDFKFPIGTSKGTLQYPISIPDELGFDVINTLQNLSNGQLAEGVQSARRILARADFLQHPGLMDAIIIFVSLAARNFWAALQLLAIRRAKSSLVEADALWEEIVYRLGDLPASLQWIRLDDLGTIESISDFKHAAHSNAQKLFKESRFVEADDCLQVLHALNNPFWNPLQPLSKLITTPYEPSNHTHEKSSYINDNQDNLSHIVAIDDPDSPRRLSFARLILETLPELQSLLDVGSYTGAGLKSFENEAILRNRSLDLIGIEPIEKALTYASEKYPQFKYLNGRIDDLVTGVFDSNLPKTIGCLTTSSVCAVISIDELEELFEWASQRVCAIAIADDVVNIEGSYPLKRQTYILHPYKFLLSKYGFEIKAIEMVGNPSRPFSGYLIATNTNNLEKPHS